MSEEQAEVTETETESTETEDTNDRLPDDHPLVKAFNEQKKLIKDLKPKAASFDQLAETAKTDLERANERAAAAEAKVAEYESEREIAGFKAQVSKKTGIPVEVLRGNNLEEISEHAASLKAILPEPRKPGQVPGEGRTVTSGSGDPAQQFAELIRNARK